MRLLCVIAALMVVSCLGKNHEKKQKQEFKVTAVATLNIEVKDYNDDGDTLTGDVKIALFGEDVPMTVLNFRSICEGYKRDKKPKYHYANTKCHRLVKDMLIQCGDVVNFDGTGTTSIFGQKFVDENFKVSHAASGVISMANHGKDTNGSQFFILFGRARYLDNHHVAFGKVLEGMDVLEELNEMGPQDNVAVPKHKVMIKDCSLETPFEPYMLPEKVFLSSDPSSMRQSN